MTTRSRGPGPGAYILPPTVGFYHHDVRKQRFPQYSFGTPHKSIGKSIGPGPGAYKLENIYRRGTDGTPKYTMRPQTFVKGPGPGAYILPPTVGFHHHDVRKQRFPQYSFGTPHKSIGKSIGPGPGAYKLENIYRHGTDGTPKYTMRPQTFVKERSRGPGPAANDMHLKPFFTGTNAPAYSLRSKYNTSIKAISPPPNSYKVEVRGIKPSSPAFSMGMNFYTKQLVNSPGPATYGRTDLNIKLHRSPAYSMAARDAFTFKTSSPGPNAYDTAYYRPGTTGAKYSFGVRHSDYAPPMIVPCDNP